jgi:hypothetical protein
MSCAINCNETPVVHTTEDLTCIGPKPAGAPSIIVYWCLDNISDISDPAQTIAALANDEALEIKDILFGSDAPAPTFGPKTVSCGSPTVLYNTQTLNITDFSYNQDNNELYEALGNGRKVAAILARDCNTKANFPDTSRYYTPSYGGITFAGGLNDADNDDEAAFFKVTGTYKGGVTIIPTPAGVFS